MRDQKFNPLTVPLLMGFLLLTCFFWSTPQTLAAPSEKKLCFNFVQFLKNKTQQQAYMRTDLVGVSATVRAAPPSARHELLQAAIEQSVKTAELAAVLAMDTSVISQSGCDNIDLGDDLEWTIDAKSSPKELKLTLKDAGSKDKGIVALSFEPRGPNQIRMTSTYRSERNSSPVDFTSTLTFGMDADVKLRTSPQELKGLVDLALENSSPQTISDLRSKPSPLSADQLLSAFHAATGPKGEALGAAAQL